MPWKKFYPIFTNIPYGKLLRRTHLQFIAPTCVHFYHMCMLAIVILYIHSYFLSCTVKLTRYIQDISIEKNQLRWIPSVEIAVQIIIPTLKYASTWSILSFVLHFSWSFKNCKFTTISRFFPHGKIHCTLIGHRLHTNWRNRDKSSAGHH